MTSTKYYSLFNYWRIARSGNKLHDRRWRCSRTTSSNRQIWRWQHLTTGEHSTSLVCRVGWHTQYSSNSTIMKTLVTEDTQHLPQCLGPMCHKMRAQTGCTPT